VSIASPRPETPRALGRRGPVERLLHRLRPHRRRRLSARELRTELAAAGLLLAVAAALPAAFPSSRDLSPELAVGCVAAHAAAARIRLYLGSGYAMPTQLVLVPMLFVLPPAAVPALVACGLATATLPDLVRGRAHPERLVTAVSDAWHAVGPALVLAAAGEPAAGLAAAPVVALALAAQSATDLAAAAAREWFGRGIAPALQAQEIGLVSAIDVCLTPVGLLTAAAATERPELGALVVLPLLALLAAFASDRRARIEEAVSRADQLLAERARLDRAIRRVGDAFASGLDRRALADLMVGTALEALDAETGRTTLAHAPAGGEPSDELRGVLAAAEAAARDRREPVAVRQDANVALAHPLAAAPGTTRPPEVLTLARHGRPFSEDERALLGYLATQAAAALENLALHDELRRQATSDELTGLANHRRFREVLAGEAERAARTGGSLALVMLDIDHFKAVNDTHGHPAGDRVLRAVANAVRANCRATASSSPP